MPLPTSTASRKRTRSTNPSESHDNREQATSSSTPSTMGSTDATTLTARPKRQRNNPPASSHTAYSLRNRASTTVSSSSSRYNLRPRRTQSPVRLPDVLPPASTSIPTRRRTSPVPPPVVAAAPTRQYRLVYISDEDDPPATSSASNNRLNTAFSVVTPHAIPRRTSRSTANGGFHIRSRTATDPTSGATASTGNSDFPSGGVAHVRLNRAIEIVIDSIQSLEGAVNNFDQFVFGLIYGRLSTRTEIESIEGMIGLSRILNLSFPSRLTQTEIDALPKITFIHKSESMLSRHLTEKCPICLTEFTDQELINKLHCTHLFHLPCISTWLSENDSCPTCRRKVNGN